MLVSDYLLPDEVAKSPDLLRTWRWLIPESHSVVLVNLFADPMVESIDGTVHYLDTGSGNLEQLASSRDELHTLLLDPDNLRDWLMIPLVDRCRSNGLQLAEGQCYAFRILPIFKEGSYDPTNVFASTIQGYLDFAGQVHQQLADTPDGSTIKIVETP